MKQAIQLIHLIQILVNRDMITVEEAEKRISETKEQILEADNLWQAESILKEQLHLDRSYLHYFLIA